MKSIMIVILIVLSSITKGQSSLNLTRGDPDLIIGIMCEGTTLQNIPGFGCFCKPESGTFYEHDGKYCHSIAQIRTVEGKFSFLYLLF